MRALLSIVSLLMVVALVAVLAKQHLSPAPVKGAPAEGSVSLPAPVAGTAPQQQSRQIQQQVRQTLENTMQQARPLPEDK